MAQQKGQLVTFKKGKVKFEIVTKPGSVLKFRDGGIGWGKVMASDTVYTNSTRGDIASGEDLKKIFGTDNMEDCCRIIVKDGDLHLSASERKQQLEVKTKEIVYHIHKNWVDPKTQLPHPPDRISGALKQAKVKVDVNGETRKQAEDAVKKMIGKLMFAKAVVLTADISIKHKDVGKCTNIIKKYAPSSREQYTADGCTFTVELSKSDLDGLVKELNTATHGGDFNFVVANDSDEKSNVDGGDVKKKKGKNAREGKGKEQKLKQRQKKQENEKEKAMRGVDKSERKKKDKRKK